MSQQILEQISCIGVISREEFLLSFGVFAKFDNGLESAHITPVNQVDEVNMGGGDDLNDIGLEV